MYVEQVISAQQRKEFISLPKELYKDDKDWVCPLDSSIESVFDPAKNHAFSFGEASRWLLYWDSGQLIGRVAAFIDRRRSDANRQPTGGMGYFEVIEDQAAAFTLFDTAKEWLESRGMQAMDGPVNFGENDSNWGLLVDGFMQQGFGMSYNKRYYREYFEKYGFKNYFDQYSFHRPIREADNKMSTFPERMMKIASWISKRPGYTFRHFEIRKREKFVNDLIDVYNSTWSVFKEDFTPLEPRVLEETFMKARPVIDEDLIWFAYFNEKPIAFFILYPDLNQILHHFNGELNILGYLRFIYYKLTHTMTRTRAIVGGVLPSHQNSGVESAIFLHIYEAFKKKPWFRELELSWVGDYNPRMISIYEALGAKKAKTHVTYRYMINKSLSFVRYKDEIKQ